MTTATAPTISHSATEDSLFDLELEFADFRSRIALMGVEASGTLTEMFLPLGAIEVDEQVIDLIDDTTVVEVFDLTTASAADASAFELLEASALELLEAFDLTVASVEEAGAICFDLEPVAV